MNIRGLAFRHARSHNQVLEDITFEAAPGTVQVILGPNGSGKTTLFKCLAGLWKPQHGSVSFDGRDLLALSEWKRARLVAVVPQDHEPPFPYSVGQIVLMGRAAYIGAFSAPSHRDEEIANQALETLDIRHLEHKSYTKLSGGERQLVLVARALAQDTPVLLLDEPTSHLDFRNQLQVLQKVRKIVHEKRLTALVTLHDPNLALLFGDSVAVINHGRIQRCGTPDEVITEELLQDVYQTPVTVLQNGRSKVISPKVEA
jgi:iron complex transport system ATP-binding protein